MIPSLLPVYQTLFAISLIVIGIAVVALAWQQRRADNAESKCCKALDEATNWKTVAKLYERTLRMEGHPAFASSVYLFRSYDQSLNDSCSPVADPFSTFCPIVLADGEGDE